jgi:hypothetical protein
MFPYRSSCVIYIFGVLLKSILPTSPSSLMPNSDDIMVGGAAEGAIANEALKFARARLCLVCTIIQLLADLSTFIQIFIKYI